MEASCFCCKNIYEPLMKISYKGKSYFFDCFECAIHVLAPECGFCGTRVIGHGAESDGVVFCSAHCARSFGKVGLVDRCESMLSSNKDF